MKSEIYRAISQAFQNGEKLLAILIDPEKFDLLQAEDFMRRIPKETTHLFVGGSSLGAIGISEAVQKLKEVSTLPVILFPGDYSQLTLHADCVLFLSLLSGRNTEYLINQQIKGAEILKRMDIEIISTAYLLIDGGNVSSVERVTGTHPMSQTDILAIVHTALAGEYMGAKLVYLEAGSGASFPVNPQIISEVKKHTSIPIIAGGGIRSERQKEEAFKAGATMVVMGTFFESERSS